MSYIIRIARHDDIQAITDIYNEAIIEGGSTSDLIPRTLQQRQVWVDAHQPKERYPVVVIENSQTGDVIGFGSLSRLHARQAYDGVVELSYYIARCARGHGHGRALVEWLLQAARERGYRMAVAIIYASNTGSMTLVQRCGFTRYGVLPNACYDGHKYYDVTYWYITCDASVPSSADSSR